MLSGYLFGLFKYILKQMAAYNITKKQPFRQKKTSTREFYQLQQLFENMQERIGNDYEQLKSYTENMSHELQTPLSIMRNKAEQLLAGEKLNQQQAEKLKTIYDEVQQLSRLSSLLNLITKIDNQELANVKEVHTKPVIEQLIQNVADFMGNRDLQIKTDLNSEHYFRIDPGLLEILLRNLMKNAITYANQNSTIHIETNNNGLQISNEGPVLEFDPSTIFNRFRKGNNSKSLGLGLAIAKQICQISYLDLSYERKTHWHIFRITKLD